MTPAVELLEVRKSYGGYVAVDGLSFSILPAHIFGLLGPNGAGKTSTIRMMIGITSPDSGSVQLFGEPLRRRALRRVGYLPEERGLYRRMTVGANLVFLGQLAGLSVATSKQRIDAWTKRLDIEDWVDRRVEELSKGMQQKIQFIAALLHDPDLIVMDEPFAGLDPVNTMQLKDVLVGLRAAGKSILFSTHRMDQVEKLCDSICLINRGKAVLQGSLSEVKNSNGRRFVQIDYEGDGGCLAGNPLIDSLNDYGNHAELRLKPGADSQELLQSAMRQLRVLRFQVMDPSLEQIFIERIAGKDD
ncbi:MAG TPA: ATP-binding cassette domain-containing protein [Candidatus Binatus sp.]|uniref:ABC transporter ATP-binding protein n=1 Tax=Candidatus Binatus sp. TaxID=2811406 RepID=UPI002B48E26D|nr:ATP-binding cassette domain-containing protein [Candidatus Binatus sp.]HKN12923.1 ATP-binding cassette domain-containing protein [Candidatus Binatus sp.]